MKAKPINSRYAGVKEIRIAASSEESNKLLAKGWVLLELTSKGYLSLSVGLGGQVPPSFAYSFILGRP